MAKILMPEMVPKQDNGFKDNEYHTKIWKHIEQDGFPSNLVVVGVAGCGKTATMVQTTFRLPEDSSIKAISFGKGIATTLSEKMPMRVESSTMNKTGHDICMLNFQKCKFNKNKLRNILRYKVFNWESANREIKDYVYQNGKHITDLVSLAKGSGISPTIGKQEFLDKLLILSDCHNIDPVDNILDKAWEVWKHAIDFSGKCPVFDFDDQVWLMAYPPSEHWSFPTYDYILIDEVQDMNAVNRLAIKRLMHEHSRVIAVGDPDQAIFGFRGADPQSVDNFVKEFDATIMYLSVCYRCSDAVIERAKRLVPRMEGTGKEGTYQEIPENVMNQFVSSGDFILCRINAPLVEHCMRLLALGKKASIKGREITKGISALAKKINSVTDFSTREIEEWHKREAVKLGNSKRPWEVRSLEDKVLVILAFKASAQVDTYEDLVEWIDTCFVDDVEEGIILSTVHKAKGLEAERVFVIRPDLMPFPKAKKSWEYIEEAHIEYVATTRALRHLYWVHR